MSSEYEDLVDRLGEADFYPYVIELINIGHDALPAVRAGMGHSNWRIRRGCAAVIDHVYDAESLRRLVLLTRDPKKKVRKMAVHSLGCDRCKDGRNPIDAVPHLSYSALNDPSVRVRRIAIIMLAIQAPERRIARILRKVLATETDPKAVRVAGWGLTSHAARHVDQVGSRVNAPDVVSLEPDPVIEAYKQDVDRTLLREQLRRTVDERVRNMNAALRFAEALAEAGRRQP